MTDEYRITYSLYDYSEKCKMGYGGTAHHSGCVVFHKDHLSIEDHETDRDAWGDAWHGRYSENHIMSDQYPMLISIMGEKYKYADLEGENETIKNIHFLLNTKEERDLFLLLLSAIREEDGITYGGSLTRKICDEKITFTNETEQYDDFYPDCDTCNYHKTETVNGR